MENENKTELKFAEGINFYLPRENAPKSIKADIVIDMAKLIDFVEKNDIKGYVRLQVRKSTRDPLPENPYYITLNTWKPTPKVGDHTAIDPTTGKDLNDNPPF